MGRKKKPRDWEELPHKKVEKKEVTEIPIYLTGVQDVTCKYLIIKNKKRNKGVVTYFCNQPKMLKKSGNILTCDGCSLRKSYK